MRINRPCKDACSSALKQDWGVELEQHQCTGTTTTFSTGRSLLSVEEEEDKKGKGTFASLGMNFTRYRWLSDTGGKVCSSSTVAGCHTKSQRISNKVIIIAPQVIIQEVDEGEEEEIRYLSKHANRKGLRSTPLLLLLFLSGGNNTDKWEGVTLEFISQSIRHWISSTELLRLSHRNWTGQRRRGINCQMKMPSATVHPSVVVHWSVHHQRQALTRETERSVVLQKERWNVRRWRVTGASRQTFPSSNLNRN